MKKRFLAALLTLCMVLALLSAPALAATGSASGSASSSGGGSSTSTEVQTDGSITSTVVSGGSSGSGSASGGGGSSNFFGLIFIRDNEWATDPDNEGCYLINVVDVEGSLTQVSVTEDIKDAVASDKTGSLSDWMSNNSYVGKLCHVEAIREDGVVTAMTPVGDLASMPNLLAISDTVVKADNVMDVVQNLSGGPAAVGDLAAMEYDDITWFIYIDLAVDDGEDIYSTHDDTLAFLGAGAFDPEGFVDFYYDVNAAREVGTTLVSEAAKTYDSVQVLATHVDADDTMADCVYVLRVVWDSSAPAPDPDPEPAPAPDPDSAPKATGWTVREVVPCQYDYIEAANGLFRVERDGKWGFLDQTTGVEVIPCRYDYAYMADYLDGETLLAVVEQGDKWGAVDQTGRTVIPFQYDDLWSVDRVSVADGEIVLAGVRQGDKWGAIDQTGQTVVPFQYDWVGDFDEETGLARVWQGEKWGCVDTAGNEVIPCKYDDGLYFSEGLAAVELDGKWGFIDTTGAEVIPCQYDDVGWFSEGLARVELDGNWGFVDQTGELVIPCQYSEVWNFSEGLAKVTQLYVTGSYDEETGMATVEQGLRDSFINATGEQVIDCSQYGYVEVAFSDGLARVKQDAKYGYIDQTGELVVPCQYDGAWPFSNGGLWKVELNGKYGFIDATGAVVIPFRYDVTTSFFHDLAGVELNDKYGVIDRTGGEVVPCVYDDLYIPYVVICGDDPDHPDKVEYMVEVIQDGKYGLLSITKGEPTPLAKSMFKVNTDQETYTGSPITKSVYGVDGDTTLVEGTDYTVSYKNNTAAGTATLTITGLGRYTGTLTYNFTIKRSGGGSSSPSGGGGAAPTIPTTPTAPTTPTTPTTPTFTDVVKGSWYEPGVNYVVDKGLFQGVAQNTFAPELNMTRAMLMTVLARLDGQSTDGGETWYAVGMAWAVAQGVSDGTMGDSNVTREQMVTMLYRYAKPEGTGDLSAFVDGESVSDWAVEAIAWAVGQGILTGKDGGRLDPQGTATRAEVATIIQRFVEKTGK